MFGDSSGTEMDVDVDTTMETESRPIIDREEKLCKIEEKLLSNKTYESFSNYDLVMSENKFNLFHKMQSISKKGLRIQQEGRFTTLRCRDNCLKNAFFNRRKFTKKLWRKRRLQDGGCYFCENYTNLFSTAVNFNFALFPYVFFTLTLR